jgi:UDP-N-acetyl-D-mannosaminouronate:lipid I N-acetyl-D-mannosaminouronosyltransferase
MKSALINGVRIFAPASFEEIIEYVEKVPSILVAVNAEKIFNATKITRKIINNNLGYPDGIGAVYALRKKGILQKTRIPGCDLWLEIIKKHHTTKTFYFVGAKPEIINATIKKIIQKYPQINICGYRDGYIKDDNEKELLINDILIKKPDIVFVAMGSPKQELLMMELFQKHTAIYQGLGGSFDLFVGLVKETPQFLQDHGLHWLYRAIQQPMNLGKAAVTAGIAPTPT